MLCLLNASHITAAISYLAREVGLVEKYLFGKNSRCTWFSGTDDYYNKD
jgi:hypothetical protein